ncbi:MAG: hypothetical protein ACK4IX_18570, partial [Candidatus Sericytochromatia bacterium]
MSKFKSFLVSTALLTISLSAFASPGSWVMLGKGPEWKGTVSGTVFNSQLYTTENNGGLFETNLDSGTWKQVGKPAFKNTQFLFSDNNSLYSIEYSGALYKINPSNGSWVGLGKFGDWKETRAVTVLNNKLYSVEESGALYETNLS